MSVQIIFISFLLLLASCGKSNSQQSEDLSETTDNGLILNQTLNVQGHERDYHIYLPEEPEKRPVVVLLHGNGGNFDQSLGLTITKSPQKIWLDLAKDHHFILLVPNGTLGPTGRRGWNDCRNDDASHPDIDDIAFIDQLLHKIKKEYNYDTAKTFVAGVSNGGILAQSLAQEIPDKITAFAAVIAAMPAHSDCTKSGIPISALFMNGTADPIMPFDGGKVPGRGGTVKSTEVTVDYWVSRNGTVQNPEVTNIPNIDKKDDCTAKKILYKKGQDHTEVVLYKIINGGHAEPSIAQRYSNFYLNFVGHQNGDIEMAVTIWDFFKDKSKVFHE